MNTAPFDDLPAAIDQVVSKHGPWTAMSIHLGNGIYTREPVIPDGRLPRLVQIAADLSHKPLDQCRVLDLACLEGHYAIEFGLQGSDVVGIEIREANLAKAEFSRQTLGIDNVRFVQDDVRNLSEEKYGRFDIILCYGILYHLDAADALEFVQRIHSVCNGLVIFDSFFSVKQETQYQFEGNDYWGRYYTEHEEDANTEEKISELFSSIDNTHSFWLTSPSMLNLLVDVGFSSAYQVLSPRYPAEMKDRPTIVAMARKSQPVLSSPIVAEFDFGRHLETPMTVIHHTQMEYSWLHHAAKRILPSSIKDTIKPLLRRLGLLHADPTPIGLKEYENHRNQ